MKDILGCLASLALLCLSAVAQSPSPEEIAVRSAYARATHAVAKPILDKLLAQGPLPANFNLNQAGAPKFILYGFTAGNAGDLAAKSAPQPNHGQMIVLDGSGKLSWKPANGFQPLVVTGSSPLTPAPGSILYSRYAQYTVQVEFQGQIQTYSALSMIGQDSKGKVSIRVFDPVAPFADPVTRQSTLMPAGQNAKICPQQPPPNRDTNPIDPAGNAVNISPGNLQPNCGIGGDGDGGGTGESWAMDVNDDGDGESIDLSFQPMLSAAGLDIDDIPDQWMDPILADPLFASPNLGSAACQQCIQDMQDKCLADRRQSVIIACSAAGVVIGGCAIAGVLTDGVAVGSCFNQSVAAGAGCLATYGATNLTFNACMTNVKWSCFSQCKS